MFWDHKARSRDVGVSALPVLGFGFGIWDLVSVLGFGIWFWFWGLGFGLGFGLGVWGLLWVLVPSTETSVLESANQGHETWWV